MCVCVYEYVLMHFWFYVHLCVCVCVWVSDSPDLFNMLVKPELLSQSRHACVNCSTPT